MVDDSQTKVIENVSTTQVLLEQYKLLENRRMLFGKQFMQTTGAVGAVFTLVVGLLGEENLILLRAACGVGGAVFIIMAVLGHRLGTRQDDCERVLSEIEAQLKNLGHTSVVTFPSGTRFGARKLIVGFLSLFGVALILIAIIGW